MNKFANKPPVAYRGFIYIYEDNFPGHITIKPIKRKPKAEVRRIRRSAARRLWQSKDYKEKVSTGVKKSWLNPKVRSKRCKAIREKARFNAIERWRRPEYRETMRWVQIRKWHKASQECRVRMSNIRGKGRRVVRRFTKSNGKI